MHDGGEILIFEHTIRIHHESANARRQQHYVARNMEIFRTEISFNIFIWRVCAYLSEGALPNAKLFPFGDGGGMFAQIINVI